MAFTPTMIATEPHADEIEMEPTADVDVIGLETATDDDGEEIEQLVVERGGEHVAIPVTNVKYGTQTIHAATDDQEDKERRLSQNYDRVYAEVQEDGTERLIAEVENSFQTLGRRAIELAEDLDDDGKPLGTFTRRKVQEKTHRDDVIIHPEEIDDDLRIVLWERDFSGRIGPKMRAATRLVASRPHSSMNELAKRVGPNGSQNYGYRIVHRCISRRLIKLDPDHEAATPSGKGAVVITKRGQAFVEEMENEN